jgi:hypothetical protein
LCRADRCSIVSALTGEAMWWAQEHNYVQRHIRRGTEDVNYVPLHHYCDCDRVIMLNMYSARSELRTEMLVLRGRHTGKLCVQARPAAHLVIRRLLLPTCSPSHSVPQLHTSFICRVRLRIGLRCFLIRERTALLLLSARGDRKRPGSRSCDVYHMK